MTHPHLLIWVPCHNAFTGDEGHFGDTDAGSLAGFSLGTGNDGGEEGGGGRRGECDGGGIGMAVGGGNRRERNPGLTVCTWVNVDIAHNVRYKECAFLSFAFRGQVGA